VGSLVVGSVMLATLRQDPAAGRIMQRIAIAMQ
jgi:hypothetical protein